MLMDMHRKDALHHPAAPPHPAVPVPLVLQLRQRQTDLILIE